MKHVIQLMLVLFWFTLENLTASPNIRFLQMYDKKVCSNEPTCNLTNNPDLPLKRLTFEGRDCMCDFECVEYNDCCRDSPYYKAPPLSDKKKKYNCFSKANVYIVDNCPSTYTDARTKDLCAKALYPLEEYNTTIIRPVTNENKRVTYANAYCAICNGDGDFELWPLTTECGEAPPGYITSSLTLLNSVNETKNKISNFTVPSKIPSIKSFKPDKFVKVDIHFNFDFIQKNKSSDVSGNTDLKLLPSGLGVPIVINKLGSNINPFGINKQRIKRDTKLNLDFNKYALNVSEIVKTAKFNQILKKFVAQYDGKDFICEFGSKMPANYSKYIRKCVPNIISECPKNIESNWLCQSYTAVVYEKSTAQPYRNKDCAVCHGVSVDTITGCPMIPRVDPSFKGKDGIIMACNKVSPEDQNNCIMRLGQN